MGTLNTVTSNTAGGAPKNETQSALAGAFIAIQAANKAIALQGKMPIVPIDGLENVNVSLATAQGHAADWEGTISANVQNTLQHVIDYNTLYAELASSINAAISEIKNATPQKPPKSGTMVNLAAELGAMGDKMTSILYGAGGTKEAPIEGSVAGTYNQMTAYQTNVGTDASTFAGYRTIAFSSKSGVSTLIVNLNKDIDNDRSAMASDRSMVGGGAAMIVTGVLICVVAVALAPETGGATIAAIGTLGVATIAGGAVMIGVASHDLDKKESDIANKTMQIANDRAELVSLTTIGNSSGDIAQHAKAIYGAMDTVLTSWQQMENQISDIVTALALPEADLMEWIHAKSGEAPSYLVMGTILNSLFAAPQAEWATASATATTILKNLKNVVLFTLPEGTVPSQAVIAKASVDQQKVG